MKKKREPVAYYILGAVSLLIAVAVLICAAGYIREKQKETRQESVKALRQYEHENIKTLQQSITYEATPDDIEEEMYFDSLELLAICVEAEAGNQPLEGRRMVADVILNRVEHPDYPDTITEVVGQPYRFSSYWDGNMDSVIEPSEETFKAVQMELEERGYPGLLYFKEGGYSEYGTPWRKVGEHYFSTE